VPSLSIVIPSAMRADLLARCLSSVVGYAPGQTEIIVVDDGSPDGIASDVACRFHGVRVLRLPQTAGFCIAANVGIASATGEVVELLNDDTEVTPGWATAALARFERKDTVAVAPLVLQLSPDRSNVLIDSAGDEYDYGGFARKRFHDQPLTAENGAVREAKPVWGASASAAFYRREALVAAGMFPPDFGAYFEDVDLAHRLQPFGTTWFEPGCTVWHRVSSSYGRAQNAALLEQQSRNEERVFWRNVTGMRLLANLPRHVAVLVAKAAKRWQEGQFSPWISGRWKAWTGR